MVSAHHITLGDFAPNLSWAAPTSVGYCEVEQLGASNVVELHDGRMPLDATVSTRAGFGVKYELSILGGFCLAQLLSLFGCLLSSPRRHVRALVSASEVGIFERHWAIVPYGACEPKDAPKTSGALVRQANRRRQRKAR